MPTRSEAAGEHPTADCEYMSESAADEEENEIIVGRWRPPPIQQTIPSNAAAGCNLKWKGEGAPRRWMIQLMVRSYLRYTDRCAEGEDLSTSAEEKQRAEKVNVTEGAAHRLPMHGPPCYEIIGRLRKATVLRYNRRGPSSIPRWSARGSPGLPWLTNWRVR